MYKQDNFEDNMYLLLNRIKVIHDTFILDADPRYFFEKTLEDIDFIDQILEKFFQWLTENNRLIDRDKLFDHLSELEWQFSRVLAEISRGQLSLPAAENAPLKDRITILHKKSMERQKNIEAAMPTLDNKPHEPVINSYELSELLKDF
jgi:hypothetical protein